MAGDRFIDKSRLNIDRTTNATAIVTLGAAFTALWQGVQSHNLGEVAVAIGLCHGAFAQWLQGSPSSETKAIFNLLGLEAGSNRDIIRNFVDRATAVRGGGNINPALSDRRVGQYASTDGRSGGVNDRDWDFNGDPLNDVDRHQPSGPSIIALPADCANFGRINLPPESINAKRAAAWRAADQARGRAPIEGTSITPAEYAVLSQAGDDDLPSEAW